jgi:hypothetical protein
MRKKHRYTLIFHENRDSSLRFFLTQHDLMRPRDPWKIEEHFRENVKRK